MKIKSLTINNYRNYVGSSTFDLTVDSDKNIVLIGGCNGAGKTSFADSIRLCLYGHRIDGEVLSETKYQEYLEDACSKSTKKKEFFISLNLVMDEENPPIDVNITRKFKKSGAKFKEELILKKGDSEVELIDENYWSYYIEKLIPPTVSRYFFFDGEKVKQIISSDESSDYLNTAISDASGVTELINLRADLVEVKKKIVGRSKSTASVDTIKKSLEEISRLNQKIFDLEISIENYGEFISKYSDEKSLAEQERSRVIGSTESKRAELLNRKKSIQETLEDVNQSVIEFSQNRLMYHLADDIIVRAVKHAKEENSSLIDKYAALSVKKILDSNNLKFSKYPENESREVLKELLDHFQCSSVERSSDVLLDLTLPRIDEIESVRVEKEELEQFFEAFHNREMYKEKISEIDKKIAKVEDGSIAELDRKIQNYNMQIEVQNIEISKLEAEKKKLLAIIKRYEDSIRAEERKLVLNDVDSNSLKIIENMFGKIDERIEKKLSKTKKDAERRMNEIYAVLKNTQDMVKEIRLTDDFRIELLDFNNKLINIKFISEGEKSILMYSVVYALHSISAIRFPVIIDSPLGRMDNTHVNNLATKLFTTISNQVVLLSTDREVVGENYKLIHPHVMREYKIVKYGTPKVTQGYFE